MNKAAAAYADLKEALGEIDPAAEFDGVEKLVAIADRHAMRCADNSEDMVGIDQNYRLVAGGFVAELVVIQYFGDPGEVDGTTLYLTLARAGELVDEVEHCGLRGKVRA